MCCSQDKQVFVVSKQTNDVPNCRSGGKARFPEAEPLAEEKEPH